MFNFQAYYDRVHFKNIKRLIRNLNILENVSLAIDNVHIFLSLVLDHFTPVLKLKILL